MWPPPKECPKCHRYWNLYPGAANYCNHMGICPMPSIVEEILTEAIHPGAPSMKPRDPLLTEREKTHGSFEHNARLSQILKSVIQGRYDGIEKSYKELCPIHREALDMIALKLSRILSGQANFRDHWDDIAGYAKLASEACEK
jgi:hypothetical protein